MLERLQYALASKAKTKVEMSKVAEKEVEGGKLTDKFILAGVLPLPTLERKKQMFEVKTQTVAD